MATPLLLLLEKKYTPNQHALAESFCVARQFLCECEVSADEHSWSMGAYANDYLEKHGRPSSVPVRNLRWRGDGKIANNKNGFIWDNCSRYGISFRTYGEIRGRCKPTIPILEGHNCPKFAGYSWRSATHRVFYAWKKEFPGHVGTTPCAIQHRTIRE